MTTASNERQELTGHGQIAHMVFPEGWVEGPPYRFEGGIGTRSFREFHPIEDPKAMLCFYYRGLPVNAALGERFHSVLEQEPHVLSDEEYSSLREILRDKHNPEDFTLISAQVEDFNGKRVLTVFGRYNKIQEDIYEIFIDADRTGRVVQEVYFQAPVDSYMKYLQDAINAMKSIEWK
jgi:hypothetical protein